MTEELKQRVKEKKTKIQRYDQRSNQYGQNRLFVSNQKRIFEEIEGVVQNESVIPDAEESKSFWGSLWDNEVQHNEEAEWLKRIRMSTRNIPEQAEVVIMRKISKQQLSKMPKWQSSGPDGVHGHWLKASPHHMRPLLNS